MEEEVLKFSKMIKCDADSILESVNILEILREFGEVRVSGSYFLDLMYKPDIDIDVISESPRKSAIQFLNKILELRLFQKQEFGDFEKFKRDNRPEAFIVVCKIEFNSRKWEIEIWFKNKFDQDKINFEENVKNLDEDKKVKVLELKSEGKLSSLEIYNKVLNSENL